MNDWQRQFEREHALRLQAEADLARRERFLSMLAEATALLNRSQTLEAALESLLGLLGQTPDVDRIALVQAHQAEGDWRFSQRYDWYQGQVRPGDSQVQNISFDEQLPGWRERLQAGAIVQGALEDFAPPVQAFLRSRSSRSILVAPIQTQAGFWGMLVFNNFQSPRPWNESEIAILRTTALNLGALLDRGESARRLAQSEASFRALFQQTFQMMGLTTPEGRVIDTNQAAMDEVLEGIGQLEGEYVWDLPLWPDQASRERMRDFIQRAAAGELIREDITVLAQGQEPRVLDYSVKPMRNAQGEISLLISEARDITEMRRIETELRELNAELEARVELRTATLEQREALLRHLFDALPDMIFSKDPEGRYLDCNQAFEAFTGLSRDQLRGHRDAELFGPDLVRVFTVLGQGLMPGELHAHEEWLTLPDQHRIYLEIRKLPYTSAQGEVTGVIGILRDLTLRKLAENAIQENEAKFRQLVDTLPVGILVVDVSGGSFFTNDAAIRMLGHEMPRSGGSELLNALPYRSVIAGSDQDYPSERHPLLRAYIYKQVSEISDLEVLHPDGRRVPMYVSGTPVLDPHGELMYAVTAFSDISELKRKEEELIEARERAEAASRAKSDFLANMSHEIRTPMNAIIGLNHLLLRSGLAAKQADHVHKIQAAAQNLLGIINDILDFSKIEAGKLRMERIGFDLHQVIVNLSNLLSLRAQEQGLELIIRLKPDLPFDLIGDPLRLEQVLLNLAGNAIKFTPAGEVEISVEALDQTSDRVQLCFRVRDTGIGIAREQQGKLFQAFSQADSSITRRYGGTGLGLMISKRLVELMKGQIGFSSEAGAGSVFWFSAWFGRQQGKPEVRQLIPAALEGLRVLAVDDHQSVLELIGDYLQGFRCRLDTARDAAGALDCLQRRLAAGEAYDLLLVDWKLGEDDGFALIEACRAQQAAPLRVILMTAYGREDVFGQVEHQLLDGILLKPLTPSLLCDAVIQAFGGGERLLSPVSAADTAALDAVRGARILLVEDNEINQAVACELLEAEGFAIELAREGREAIEKLKAWPPGHCALVLMDLHMPVLDGYGATRALRADPAFAALPIVAMTADAVAGIREQVLAAGMNDFVTKPIVLAELFGVLAKWLPATATATPRPNRQQAQPELPPLPGIETYDALLRLGGNVPLYAKLLRRFGAELPDRLAELAAAIAREAGQPEAGTPEANHQASQEANHEAYHEAYQLAHTLKGTAGNLGLTGLQARMASLEQALKSRDQASAETLLEQARLQLQPLLPQLEHLRLEPVPAPPLSPDEARLLQAQLRQALQNYDPNAAELLERLKPGLPDSGRLEALIDNFDFEAALQLWDELRREPSPKEAPRRERP